MNKNKNKYICIHGHFYQPPRENAWLEQIEVQESAAPFHDWNERINDECYGPNAHARILDSSGKIVDITNNYEKISFNMGPTLLSWMELHRPDTYQLILDADKESLKHFNGHGSAIAQVYNHIIMPLASRRDKETQIKWGLYDFEKRFSRPSEGIWLAETAVDTETLECLYDNGVKYTILAPNQAKRFRGDSEWHEGINPNRPYIVKLSGNRQMVLYFYNGEVSQQVAFNGLLNDGKRFAENLMNGFTKSANEPELLNIATDGESYGHHHRMGEMALAYCLHHLENNTDATVTNYGAYLAENEPTYQAEIHENSSWSCAHGVERWKSNCGCHTGGEANWNQEWRAPLRQGLDWLKDKIDTIYETELSSFVKDPWNLRDRFVEIVYQADKRHYLPFLEKYLPEVSREQITHAIRMLEMQRNGMLMFTSCGWFFNDVSGIETVQILQYANRAIQLAERESEVNLESKFLEYLAKGHSNLPEFGSIKDIYDKYVTPKRMTLSKVGMHYGVHVLFAENPNALQVFNYNIETNNFKRFKSGQQVLCVGRAEVRSKVTLSVKYMSFAVLYLGNHHVIGGTSDDYNEKNFFELADKLEYEFKESQIASVISDIQEHFAHTKFSFFDLMKDEQKKILDEVIDQNVEDAVSSISRISKQNYGLLNLMRKQKLIPPAVLWQNLKIKLQYDLQSALNDLSVKGDYGAVFIALIEFKNWNIKPEGRFGYKFTKSIDYLIERGRLEPFQTITLLNYLEEMSLELNPIQMQNYVFEKIRQKDERDWTELAIRIGIRIG